MPYTRMHEGPSYREFIIDVVRKKSARSYLEVGVHQGETLAQVNCPSIGVDPAFFVTVDIIGKKEALFLFQMTSDAFFRKHDPRAILGVPVDVIFLDGLHQFEFLLRDFINSEAVAHRDSLIMLDDCLPNNAEMTERVANSHKRIDRSIADWWTGDVWKVVSILKKYRPDLVVQCVDVRPTGSVCVTNLDPESRVLKENYYQIVTEYLRQEMSDERLAMFYEEANVVSGFSVLNGTEASIIIGP